MIITQVKAFPRPHRTPEGQMIATSEKPIATRPLAAFNSRQSPPRLRVFLEKAKLGVNLTETAK